MAAITVRELLTKWGFEADTKPIDKLNKSLTDVKTTVTLIGAAAISQVGAIFGLTNAVSKTGDDFAKMASRIGINVEALQEYSHVSKLAGSSTQEMNSSIASLTLGIAEARKGSGKLIEPLIRLNQLTGQDLLTSMGDADDLFLKLSDSLGQVEDSAEKAELATKIFGGTGLAMVNILNQGSVAIRQQRQEARDLGIVLSEKAARQSEIFQDSLLRVKGAVEGIRNIVGIELMPVVVEFMDRIKEWILINREWLKTNIVKTLRRMFESIKSTIKVVKAMARVMKAAINAMGGFERVLKTVLFLMTAFTAIKFLSAIGNLAMAVGGALVLAFRAAGNAALFAQLKMAAIPIAIGLAIALVLLALDDLKAFFEGRDSVTGLIVEKFKGLDIKQILKDKLDSAINVVEEFSDKIQDKLKDLFTFEDPGPALRKSIRQGLEGLEKFFDDLSLDNLEEKLGKLLLDAITADTILNKILSLFATVFQAIGDSLLIVIAGVVDTALLAIKGIFEGMQDFAGKDNAFLKPLELLGNVFTTTKGLLFGDDDEKKTDLAGNLATAGASPGTRKLPFPEFTGPPVKLSNSFVERRAAQERAKNVVHNNMQTTVNVPSGTSKEDAIEMVEKAFNNMSDRQARETQAAVATNVEQ